MDKYKIGIGEQYYSGDFWYDITLGGYINPEDIMSDPKVAEKLNQAIQLLNDWYEELLEDGIIEER